MIGVIKVNKDTNQGSSKNLSLLRPKLHFHLLSKSLDTFYLLFDSPLVLGRTVELTWSRVFSSKSYVWTSSTPRSLIKGILRRTKPWGTFQKWTSVSRYHVLWLVSEGPNQLLFDSRLYFLKSLTESFVIGPKVRITEQR